MKHTKKFEHSVNVLLKAYLNDTLEHGNCFACAVGNLVASSMCIQLIKVTPYDPGYGAYRNMWSNGMRHKWNGVFVTTGKPGSKRQEIDGPYYRDEAKKQIDSTGYSVKELAAIEFAFENAQLGNSKDDYMFNGLMAVVDVLAEIHEIDLATVKSSKALFV